MASKQLQERAQAAIELAKDYLLKEDDESINENEDEFDDDENEDEIGAEDESAKSEDGEKNSNAEKTQDPVTEKKNKKKSHVVGRKLKSLMGIIMNPLGAHFSWAINLNMNASNVKAKGGGKSNAKSNDAETAQVGRDKPTSSDAAKIKSLECEIKRLQKLAGDYLDGYIELKKRIGELSETEGQLATVKNENEHLKEELLEMQKQRQNSSSSVAEQTEAYRKEINRLDSELRAAEANLLKMQTTDKGHRDALNEANKALETLTSQHDKHKSEVAKKEELHKLEIIKLNDSLHASETEKTELRSRVQKIQQDLQTALLQCNELAEERTKLQQKMSELQYVYFTIKANYEASNAKVAELQRAIQVLESNSSTTTTLQGRGDGYTCPLCEGHFDSLASMQLHAEDCSGS